MIETAAAPATRDAILDAVDVLLARYGYRKMTMEDVASEAGVGKGTIYLHFPGKEELVLSHVDRIVERVVARMGEIRSSGLPAGEAVRRMLRERVMVRFDAVQHYRESLSELLAAVRPALLARRKRHLAREAEVLAEALAAPDFGGGGAFDLAETMLAATNALLPFGLSAKELGSRAAVAQRVEAIAALLVDGATRAGGRDRGARRGR
ncbi:MAG: helix-turn-helix domain-containing protein [Vicinamibacteria bacterium]